MTYKIEDFKISEEVIINVPNKGLCLASIIKISRNTDTVHYVREAMPGIGIKEEKATISWFLTHVTKKENKKSNKKKEDKNMKTTQQYSFQSPHDNSIDFEKISQDLSYSNPIALVNINDKRGYVIIHASIYDKAEHNKTEVRIPTGSLSTINRTRVIRVHSITDFSKAIKEVKRIKGLRWEKGSKSTVTVSLPQV